MNSSPFPTRIALTGAAGFLGRSLVAGLSPHFALRTLDINPTEGDGEKLVGSVADPATADALCQGCSHLVIAHMAPNRPEIYGTPEVPFDVNVKGVANLFDAAVRHGIRRTVLISSTAVVSGYEKGRFLDRHLPERPASIYSLTKALQESIAHYYHDRHAMEVAVFRPAHICDEDHLIDKYNQQFQRASWTMIDPRDIAEAVRLALLAPKIDYQTFYILGHTEAHVHADMQHIRDFLGWTPQHTFAKYPRAEAA